MKKGKILLVAAIAVLTMSVFVGCGWSDNAKEDTNTNEVTDKTVDEEKENETNKDTDKKDTKKDENKKKEDGGIVEDAVEGAGDATEDVLDGAGDVVQDVTGGDTRDDNKKTNQ